MNKESQKNLKVLSKILYALTKLIRIFLVIGFVSLILCMMIFPPILKNIKVTKDTATFNKEEYKLKIEDDKIILTDKNNKDFSVEITEDINIEKYLENYNPKEVILYSEIFLISTLITLIISYIIIKEIEKLFYNLYTKNPFTEENTNIIKKVAKYSIYSLIISIILQIIFELIFESNIEITSVNIMTIMVLYILSYICEYGTKLQEKSKENIYS